MDPTSRAFCGLGKELGANCRCSLKNQSMPGWWFGTCFIFHILGMIIPTGELHHFSEGLKPPSRCQSNCCVSNVALESEDQFDPCLVALTCSTSWFHQGAFILAESAFSFQSTTSCFPEMFGISIHDYPTLSNIIQLCQWFLNIHESCMLRKPTVKIQGNHGNRQQLQEFFTPIVKATRGRDRHRSGDVPQQKKRLRSAEVKRSSASTRFRNMRH